MNVKNFFSKIKDYKSILIFLLTPLIAAIVPLVIGTNASKCAFVVIVMAVFWLTEVLPMCVTSLLPILLFPALGIMKSEQVCPLYFKEICILFFGGLTIASAIELVNLHKRIALFVLIRFGSNPKWLMLGFMLVTAFLSFWISNTACTAMMLPVVTAVVNQLNAHERDTKKAQKKSDAIEMQIVNENSGEGTKINEPDDELSIEQQKLSKGFLFCCAYSSSIGGLGSLVGTTSNILLKGHFDKYHPDSQLDFLSFMLYSLPISILLLFISWIWLTVRWLPGTILPKRCMKSKIEPKKTEQPNQSINYMLRQKYIQLGPMSWAEKCVGFVFIVLVLLWITRDFHAAPGWNYFFVSKFVSDSTASIFAVFLLFILPSENIFKGKPYKNLLDWKTLQRVFPWDVLLLLGGSLAMADGFQVSGLSGWIGSQFSAFSGSRKEVLLFISQIVSAIATEFTSNVSIASVFIPLFDTLSEQLNISSIYLLLPITLSVCLGFMLPVASPTNAMIFASGRIRFIDMVSTGIVMNIIGILVIFIASNTWMSLVFDLSAPYSNSTNSSIAL